MERVEKLKDICLITYTRSSEGFTKALDQISCALYERYKERFKVVICCEKKFEVLEKPYEISFMEMEGTKYRRLVCCMEQDDSRYYLSIDNDITGRIDELLNFVETMMEQNYEVGWGRIKAKRQQGFISNMVAVDKLLSHNIIRPLLWKLGIGISIPGQVFCIKGESYRGKLIDLDTYLDDLALGLYVNINHSRKYIISTVLGEEMPNSRFKGLWMQRSRWAIGYSTILKAVKNRKKYRNKVIIHGISYHFSWILNWLVYLLSAYIWRPMAVAYGIVISLMIAGKDLRMIFYTLIYQVFFPIFHIRWMIILFRELLKEK